ncbi:MAG: ATP-binding protein [Aeromicrobium sp.]|nr:MAG: ATP-binding protein [Aeromicrobium sp.]
MLPAGTIDRRLSALLASRALEEPVIALHGPRSVGKSTVLRGFAERVGSFVVDLDEPEVRAAVASNPAAAVSTPAPVCIDEYQHALGVLDALKSRLNREGSLPGTAVLTGSTRQDFLPRTAQALTGRLHSITIWPLSQGEIGGIEENLLDALRRNPAAAVDAIPVSTTTRAEYVDRVCAGGFPLALKRTTGVSRNRWFDDYVRQSVERDAVELARIQQRQALGKLLNRLAGRTGQVLNLTNAGQGLGLSLTTLQDYATLLEDLFLIERLPAWGKTLRKRSVSSPKLHVIDSGVAARLMRISPEKLATLEPTALTEFGNLLETFVVGELRKQVSWLDEPVTLGHWRTHDDDEVDFVVEFADGGVLAFEVKANERIGESDFKGMRKLRDALGERFIAGIGFTTGTRSYSGYEDRIHVMPIDRLWQPV